MMKVIRYCCFVVSSTQDLEIYLKKVVNDAFLCSLKQPYYNTASNSEIETYLNIYARYFQVQTFQFTRTHFAFTRTEGHHDMS
jgi:hypothetical protein